MKTTVSDGDGEPRAATRSPGRGGLSVELEEEIRAVADSNGCELVHAEFGGGVMRLFIDRPERPGGVDLSDCETISKQVSALLDVVDFAPGRYTLEVSSPGLDRKLYRMEDYRRFTGSLARVTFREPESGQKRTVVGRLGGLREGVAEPQVEIAVDDGETMVLPLAAIELAKLEIEL